MLVFSSSELRFKFNARNSNTSILLAVTSVLILESSKLARLISNERKHQVVNAITLGFEKQLHKKYAQQIEWEVDYWLVVYITLNWTKVHG